MVNISQIGVVFFELFDEGASEVFFGDEGFVLEGFAGVSYGAFDKNAGGAGGDADAMGVDFEGFLDGFVVDGVHEIVTFE